ncbi:unnamed protein product [Protopolystoma xenopodis]|uniref:G-protein coupled receptors family 1 profile domain-containing protein n=1 Tax=Protopolystoma xenopodis TaxID=117903 RepID=A0A3S5AR88_9PLAT|nr:unnamed protein product [Protopolystoma xenopodis]
MALIMSYFVWLVLALLVDRQLYLSLGFHSSAVCSRSQSARVTVAISLAMAIYTAPLFCEFTWQAYPSLGLVRVVRTRFGNNQTFKLLNCMP